MYCVPENAHERSSLETPVLNWALLPRFKAGCQLRREMKRKPVNYAGEIALKQDFTRPTLKGLC
jgi:hypothetical protein